MNGDARELTKLRWVGLVPLAGCLIAENVIVHPAGVLFGLTNLAAGLTAFAGLAAAAVSGGERIGQRRWRKLVPSIEHGPSLPSAGFVVYVPEKRAFSKGGVGKIRFHAQAYEWDCPDTAVIGRWLKIKPDSRPKLRGVQCEWSADAPVAEVAAAWFDFCAGVEAFNRELADAHAAKRRAEAERRALTSDGKEQAQQLAALLPQPTRR